MQHYISDSIYGLTLAWITSENSTKQLECRHLLTRFSSLDPIFSATVSGVDRVSPCPVANYCVLLFRTNSLFASPYHFRTRRDFKSKNPLSGFALKQTKESSAWRATYIVSQNYRNWTSNCSHTLPFSWSGLLVTAGCLQTSKECSRKRGLTAVKEWYRKLRHILMPKTNHSTKKVFILREMLESVYYYKRKICWWITSDFA